MVSYLLKSNKQMSATKDFFTGAGAGGRIFMVVGLVIVLALAIAGLAVATVSHSSTSGPLAATVATLAANQEKQSRGTAVIYGNIGVPACPYYCNNPSKYPEIFAQAPVMKSWRGATSLATDAALLIGIDQSSGQRHGLCTCVEDPSHPFGSMSESDQSQQFAGAPSWDYTLPTFESVA
jgi:hypothetical protein